MYKDEKRFCFRVYFDSELVDHEEAPGTMAPRQILQSTDASTSFFYILFDRFKLVEIDAFIGHVLHGFPE